MTKVSHTAKTSFLEEKSEPNSLTQEMSLLMSFFVSPNGIYVVIVSLQVVFPSYLKKKTKPKPQNQKQETKQQ